MALAAKAEERLVRILDRLALAFGESLPFLMQRMDVVAWRRAGPPRPARRGFSSCRRTKKQGLIPLPPPSLQCPLDVEPQ